MDRAGQESFIMNVYRKIDRNQIQFKFLCTNDQPGDFDEEIRQLGGELFYLPQIACPSNHFIKKYLEMVDNLAKWLAENREEFDVVHLHTYHASDVWVHLEACRRAGVKRVAIHSHNTQGPHRAFHACMRFINNFYSFQAFACSEEAGEWLFGKNMVRRGEVTVVYNGIDVEQYAYRAEVSSQYKAQFGVANKRVLGHIGRFNEQKNHVFLMEIFEAYHQMDPDSVLLLVGRGDLEAKIRNIAKEKGLDDSVIFAGVRNDIPQLLSMMDIFVFPSLYEGLAVALIEAQTSGVCVLANENTTPEAIISDNIKLLPLGDAQQWATVIAEQIGQRTSNIDVKKFDINCTYQVIEQKYMEMMERR
jgi:glycosyltransferase involved in cell wall biosynthesis